MNLVYLTFGYDYKSRVPDLDQGDYESSVPDLGLADYESSVPDLDPGDYTIWCASP
jgi:hypothetical protein